MDWFLYDRDPHHEKVNDYLKTDRPKKSCIGRLLNREKQMEEFTDLVSGGFSKL